ncbi:MAG: trypsin-like peptidase domain-containing protein [Microbacterium sp.]
MSENVEFEPAAVATAQRPWYRRRSTVACTAATLAIATALAVGLPLATAAEAAEASAKATGTSTVVADRDTPGGGQGWSGTQGDAQTQGEGQTQTQAQTTQEEATTASSDESTGVVLIDTDLGYYDASAAGTGMVLTSDGLVLTNNHVVAGATEITVTDPSTGQTYTASVVGTDAEDDVALLQLEDASGLTTVTIDDDDEESVGDDITAVGNAEGGGTLLAADGTITDLDSTVTTEAEGVVDSETLDGMIEISADVVSGDSGGALLDDEGEVIGMTTAASSGTAYVTAYAIPIEDALQIVDQILAGDESDGVTLGYPAFLGVYFSETTASYGPGAFEQTQTATAGATIAGVLDGTPAAEAGLTSGDTITAVDGVAVADSDALSELLDGYEPGDTVTLTYVDASGTTQTATVTLIDGPVA